MNTTAESLHKLLYLSQSLCQFASEMAKHYDCQFVIEIGNDKLNFDLPELVAEVLTCRQVLIDDIEVFSSKQASYGIKSIFDEPFIPDITTVKTSDDEIVMSDFDYMRKDMPDSVKNFFDMLLPVSILTEAKKHEELDSPMTKSERVKAIEMHTMLLMAQIATK